MVFTSVSQQMQRLGEEEGEAVQVSLASIREGEWLV